MENGVDTAERTVRSKEMPRKIIGREFVCLKFDASNTSAVGRRLQSCVSCRASARLL